MRTAGAGTTHHRWIAVALAGTALTTIAACGSQQRYCSSGVRSVVARLANDLPRPNGATELDASGGTRCADSDDTLIDSHTWIITGDGDTKLRTVQAAALAQDWTQANLPNMSPPESATLRRFSQRIDDKSYWLTVALAHSNGAVPGQEGQQTYDSLTISVSAGSAPYD